MLISIISTNKVEFERVSTQKVKGIPGAYSTHKDPWKGGFPYEQNQTHHRPGAHPGPLLSQRAGHSPLVPGHPQLCKQVDDRDGVYDLPLLRAMYRYLDRHGDLYYIKYRRRLCGDVCLHPDGEISIGVAAPGRINTSAAGSSAS